jgi:hypothetical protein
MVHLSRRAFRLSLIVLLGGVVACSNGASSSPSGSAPQGSGPGPEATPWPSGVVESVIALGVADPSFEQIGKDLNLAVNSGDLAKLLAVTDEATTFLSVNQKNIPRLQGYAETKSVGDRLAPAYEQMLAGIKQIHDALVAGDGKGVTAGFETFVAGNALYTPVRQDLADLANQAIFMKRHYNL